MDALSSVNAGFGRLRTDKAAPADTPDDLPHLIRRCISHWGGGGLPLCIIVRQEDGFDLDVVTLCINLELSHDILNLFA